MFPLHSSSNNLGCQRNGTFIQNDDESVDRLTNNSPFCQGGQFDSNNECFCEIVSAGHRPVMLRLS